MKNSLANTSSNILQIVQHNSFKKDFKLLIKRGYDKNELFEVIDLIAAQEPLPPKYKNHKLVGISYEFMECHIRPDWLLIYKVDIEQGIVYLVRTGTHSDLF